MGMKQIIAGAVAACGIMAVHSPAWAIAVNTQPIPLEHRLPDGTPMTPQQIALTQQLGITPAQVAQLQEMVVAANSGNAPMIKVESWTWVLSVIPGLGQFVMGDQMRGIIIFLVGVLGPTVLSILAGVLTVATAGFFGLGWIISSVIGLASLIYWLWNLWDAYQMNQRLLGRSAELQITPDLRARRKDGEVALNYTFGRF